MKQKPDYQVSKNLAYYCCIAFSWGMLGLSAVLPLVYMILCFLEGEFSSGTVIQMAILVFGCVAFGYLMFTIVKMASVRIWFLRDGLLQKIFGEREIFVPWQELQQVCICYSEYTTGGPRIGFPALVCVKKGEKKNGMMRWKTSNIFHFRSVITMDFTPQLYNRLKELCPLEIVDLRDTPAYKL